MQPQNKPIVGTMIGDPAGIGPEVVVKSLASGEPYEMSRPVLIGCIEAVEQAIEITGTHFRIRRVSDTSDVGLDPDVIDIMDTGQLDPKDYRLGEETAACGRATANWLQELNQLASSGKIKGSIMGPVNTGSLKLADRFDAVVNIEPGSTYLTLFTGPLRIVHLTDHIPLRDVSKLISRDLVYGALRTIHDSFHGWGVKNPRIAVCGFNPHAYGDEENKEMVPAVERAKAEGIGVSGPIAPDTVFRHCIDGRYDIVLAMYHDQGHIAVKTWGFVGNCAMILGIPYIQMSVAHGTAFDIVGQNKASHEMMLMAMKQTASLAAGRGFLPVSKAAIN